MILASGLWQESITYVAPKFLGAIVSQVLPVSVLPKQPQQLTEVTTAVGEDVCIRGRRPEECSQD